MDSASPFVIHGITPHIREFNKLYPGITIELYSNERTIDLIEKKIDVAIRIGKMEDSTMHAISLGMGRRRILASPSYLKEFGTPKNFEDLKNHKLIGCTDPKHFNSWPIKNANSPLVFQSLASSGEAILNLTLEGAGISCLSDFMTNKYRANGKLVQILVGHTSEMKEPIHAVYYKNAKRSNRMNVFIQFLKAKIKL